MRGALRLVLEVMFLDVGWHDSGVRHLASGEGGWGSDVNFSIVTSRPWKQTYDL